MWFESREKLREVVIWAASTAIVLLIWVFLPPFWETDDVSMAMIAHGYGHVSEGSPLLIFSNVLWGYFVHSLPTIYGWNGYAIGTMMCLVLVVRALFHLLTLWGCNRWLSCLVCVAILVRPILFPQFTLAAGLLMVCAVLLAREWLSDDNHISNIQLTILVALAYLSFLVRGPEALFVLIVCLPSLYSLHKGIVSNARPIMMASASLVLLVGGAILLDKESYSGDRWNDFKQLNLPRAAFTDFGAARELYDTEAAAKSGYSNNDLNLLRNWFFVDDDITNPAKLSMMLEEIGFNSIDSKQMTNGWRGFNYLANPYLAFLIIAGVLLLLLKPRKEQILMWSLFLVLVWLLGFLGRPNALRVYYPVVSLLVLVSLKSYYLSPASEGGRRWPVLVIFLLAAVQSFTVLNLNQTSQINSKKIVSAINDFEVQEIVAWGGAFPFLLAYPVTNIDPQMLELQIVGLGTTTKAPFSIAQSQRAKGLGVVERLISEEGIVLAANAKQLDLLNVYCGERHGLNLIISRSEAIEKYALHWVRCTASGSV